MASEMIHLEGHVIDSLTLSKVLDILSSYEGVRYEVRHAKIGHTRTETSKFDILVEAETEELLERVLEAVQQHGAYFSHEDARLEPAPKDGVFPEDFYSTTNLETFVRVHHRWVHVENIEMDCGVRVWHEEGRWRAATVPMARVKRGDLIVVGHEGIRVTPPERRDPTSVFAFMGSDVSSEKPKERAVRGVAEEVRKAKARGEKVLFVGGPAIIHTGAGPYLEQLIRNGWIDVLFAGNALAAHDVESALYGTSLGVSLDLGAPVTHGHQHHIRAINKIRLLGGLKQAVEQGVLTRGVMYTCIKHNIPFVLAGSIRDDGPLPEVITDVLEAQDAMRAHIPGVGVAIMVATTLHSVATGNMLPASVRVFCVDNDADTVIKLTDRGTHQTFPIVTDCHFFMKELALHLVEPFRSG
ncbi:MAG: TIGR00300 family protein [Armatimonadetes bacterium JP3_11]|jgi:lysine-ketoglutarate reductase/saccharopine dehydrogenase-like protein (TIGR00300 family)|nr:MAG: TIGR00300 family protein [Armatimonadetes bacterium CP1_7O]OYT74655.1 MAG: TIGR00300 family protein [Armatimonadetes bacterium JP3_11]RMH10578.1 MAG: TIGR00300 family protein [Armatimonadota bacterium]